MSRRALLALVPAALAAALLALAACRDDPAPTGPRPASATSVGPAVPGPVVGTPGLPARPEDLDAANRRRDEQLADLDRQARERITKFRGLVYDPSRDARLRAAAGGVEMDVDGARAAYAFEFDRSRKLDDQLRLTTVREDAGIHPGTAAQAKRFAIFGVRGAYSQVISHAPPLQWQLVVGRDGTAILVAPPFQSAKGASYRLDPNGLVALAGETDGKTAVRTSFRWSPFAGKSILTGQIEDEGKSTTDYEYTTDGDLALLSRAVLTEGVHVVTARLTWSRVDRD